MSRCRILLIHTSAGGLGDRIRINQILHFLKDSGFTVFEGVLPSLTRYYIRKEGFSNILTSLLPLHKFKLFDMKSLVYQNLNFTIALNYLRRLRQKLEVDVIIAESYLLGLFALQVFGSKSIPIIVDAHGLAGAEARGYKERFWHIKEATEVDVFRRCTHLLVVSDTMKQYIVRYFNIASEKISVIYNGASLPSFKAKFALPLKVIYAGNFAYWERVDDYLDLAKAAKSSTFRFYLAGAGPLQEHILSRIKHEKIPIKFLGSLSRSAVLELMSDMQVGIAPSTRDTTRLVGFPIKLLDYMSVGLPVITPLIGDWGRLVEMENSGIALKEDSTEKYHDALRTLVDEGTWQLKSNNGVRTIREKYQWKNVLEPLSHLITKLTE